MKNRKETYNKKGLYNGYDKKHKERDSLDYYSTPTKEVINILETINLDLDESSILEPCIGGGHMMEGILQYLENHNAAAAITGTDIKDRNYKNDKVNSLMYNLDFLSDDYEEHLILPPEYIIMNPPYSTIEPFIMKALGLATKGVLMLGRLQFLEGKGRYENILKDFPPSDVWVYVDRISCSKNGIEPMGAVQAYAWFYWNVEKIDNNEKYESKLHWIRRIDN